MSSSDINSKIEQTKLAIAAQESLRGILDDAIVEITLSALNSQLSELTALPETGQQRKLLTILFTDVVDSTRLLAEMDPEENMAIMDDALRRLANPVEQYGGRVLRFMGDGYLAAFGLSQAQENDPEMAVRAGLGILEMARKIADRLEAERQLAGFQVRVGINTGLVVAGGVTEGEGTIMGAAVNLAARLESAAPPNGLLISQYTYPHVRGMFDFGPAEPISAKGFAEPVKAYMVKQAKPSNFRLNTRGIEGIETNMVGRALELASLREAVEAMTQGHGGSFISIVGDAGLGKSRLLAEFERWLEPRESGIAILRARATLESSDLPYALLRDLITRWVGILDDDPLTTVREKIVGGFKLAIAEGSSPERNAHFVGHLLGYDFGNSPYLQGALDDPRQFHDRALLYLSAFLKDLVASRPLAIFLDDIHWADGKSLDVLLHLFQELPDEKLLLVALTRPSLMDRRPTWGEQAGHRRITLRPLSRKESQGLVEEVLKKVEDLPVQLRELIIENAEGNPFYLEELVKMLVEDGVIERNEPVWQVKIDRLSNLRVPPTLTGVLQARIESLSENERRILQQASVIGRVFWDLAVCHLDQEATNSQLASQTDEPEAKKILASLQAREMITEHSTSAFSDAVEYLFQHTILREVTYESVLKRMRRVYHGLVADWLIAQSGERTREVTGLIAGHLEKAGKNVEALEQLSYAARMAASSYALNEAVDFYNRALALAPESDLEKRFELLHARMNILLSQGNRTAQRTDLDELASIATLLGDSNKQAQVALDWAWFYYWVSDFPEALSAGKRVLTLAATPALRPIAMQAHILLAWAESQLARFESALTHAEMALDMARMSNDRGAEQDFLTVVGSIRSAIGDFSAARAAGERALALSRELEDPSAVGPKLNNLGVVLTQLGDFENAREMYQQYREISHERGYLIGEATALINLGWVLEAQGSWVLAKEHALEGVRLATKADYLEAAAEGLVWLGHACLGLEQLEEAETAYQKSLEIRESLGQVDRSMGTVAGLARTALSHGDLEAAVKRADEILTFLADGGTLYGTWEPLRIRLTCIQVLEQAGEPRSEEVLAETYALLQEQASQITEDLDRRSYLENVLWHREIRSRWEQLQARR